MYLWEGAFRHMAASQDLLQTQTPSTGSQYKTAVCMCVYVFVAYWNQGLYGNFMVMCGVKGQTETHVLLMTAKVA